MTDGAADAGGTKKTRHKWLVAMGLLITVAAWLAWTLLTAESDVAPQGSLAPPGQYLAPRV